MTDRVQDRSTCPDCGGHGVGCNGCGGLGWVVLVDASSKREAEPLNAPGLVHARRLAQIEREQKERDAIPKRAAEHYPGEPTAAEMIRDLQMAMFGESYATPHSPAEEWRRLLDVISKAGEMLDEAHATPKRVHGFYRLGRVKVSIEDGPLSTPCHVWQGTVDGQGYAKRGHHGRRHTNAHRDVYLLEHGQISTGYILHHECENKLCLNVDHMQAVTRGDHVRIHRKGKPLIGGRGG